MCRLVGTNQAEVVITFLSENIAVADIVGAIHDSLMLSPDNPPIS